MSKPLKNPELPPGAIVQTFKGGGALRNDGVTLTPASQNPWYVLATVAGEQEGASLIYIDHDLHAKNRRFWNGWMCQGIEEEEERAELAEKIGLPKAELARLDEAEMEAVNARFGEAFPDQKPEDAIPHPGFLADFRRVYFPKSVTFSKCILRHALFDRAHFTRDADFHGGHFIGGAHSLGRISPALRFSKRRI